MCEVSELAGLVPLPCASHMGEPSNFTIYQGYFPKIYTIVIFLLLKYTRFTIQNNDRECENFSNECNKLEILLSIIIDLSVQNIEINLGIINQVRMQSTYQDHIANE